MKKFLAIFVVALLPLNGCSAIKSAIEDEVKSSVEEKVHQKVDEVLASKGLTLDQIKASIDANHDGKITKQEVMASLKDYSKDFFLLEAQKYFAEKANPNVDSKVQDIWQHVIAIISAAISAFLLKEIRSAKTNSQTQARLEIMEKLLGYDPEDANHVITPPVPAARLAVAVRKRIRNKGVTV